MKPIHYHFIGIGGIGMSALARVLLDQNIPVTGSDLALSPISERLIQKGARIHIGQAAEQIPHGATVVYSSDIKNDNPEFQAALAKEHPLLHRSDLLAELMKDSKTLAVAGTHGKTTTSSLLTTVLMQAGKDPTFAVGGILPNEGYLNGKKGKGEFFVAEADESDGTFLKYFPHGAIVTNVECEHLDHYGNQAAIERAFSQFLSQVSSPEHLFYCIDDPLLKTLAAGRGVSYGFSSDADVKILRFQQEGWKILFDLAFEGKEYREIELCLIGAHNVLNASAVFGLCLKLGISEEEIRKTFREFSGVGRRCEKKGESHGILMIDDYAHHPTEVYATLKGIREAVEERRIVCVFQPHRYSRLRDFMEDFTRVFEFADHLFVVDVYSAREREIEGVNSQILIEKIRKNSTIECANLPKESAEEILGDFLRPHDVLVTLGAGDITALPSKILKNFTVKPPRKLKVALIFGGRSVEHEVSLNTARFFSDALDHELYDVSYVGISKEGSWTIEDTVGVSQQKDSNLLSKEVIDLLLSCDILVPALHGPNCEDGTIQGFFEMLNKPYLGADYRACAIAMDKALSKERAAAFGVPVHPFLFFTHWEWKNAPDRWLQKIEKSLPFPLFVKPIHLGSSVGITKVQTKEKLREAIDYAFRFDTDVIVEKGIEAGREIEFAVLGSLKGKIRVPPPAEICSEGVFYDYEKKYGANATPVDVYPDLSPELLKKGRMYAQQAYEAIGCTGMARVDFFLDREGNFWFGEINPFPGCTVNSGYPKIWQREGWTSRNLVDRLIRLGMQRKRDQNRHGCLN